MNFILGFVASTVAVLMLLGVVSVVSHNWGYKAGHKDGYAAGCQDAENWWRKAEVEVGEARQNIWREEKSDRS